jgi:fructan beta-fructosidase
MARTDELPRRLSFARDGAGLALKQESLMAPLRGKSFPVAWPALGNSSRGALGESAIVPYELELQFGHPGEPIFGIRLYSDEQHWTEIGFDRNKEEFYIDRTRSGAIVSADFPARTRAPLAAGRPACRGSVLSGGLCATVRLP